MQLENKVAIVTGSSRGLGKRIAKALAREGAAVVVMARTEKPGDVVGTIHETVREIQDGGGKAVGVRCDLGVESDIQNLVAFTLSRYGKIDIIVNNAIMRVLTPLLETSAAEMEQIFAVNVLGPFRLCKYALPSMIERGQGNIINIKTTDSLQPKMAGRGPHQVSKAALTLLSVELALEVKGLGIAVNAFHPGHVITEGSAATRARKAQRYGQHIISDRKVRGDPPEVCDEPIVYLAAQTAATFTGRVVHREDYGKTWGPGIGSS